MPLVVVERFQHTWRGYLDSVVRQAANRDRKHILHPEEYLAERVDNIGILPCYAIGEQCAKLEIPRECMEHPILEEMRTCVSHIVTLTNVSLTSPASLFMSADITHVGHLLLQERENCKRLGLQRHHDRHDPLSLRS